YMGSIYVYDLRSSDSKKIARGYNPTWSPNGRWVSFRSSNGAGALLRRSGPVDTRLAGLFSSIKLLGQVIWSPDSRYILVAEPSGPIENILAGQSPLGPTGKMVVYRLADGAHSVISWIDSD